MAIWSSPSTVSRASAIVPLWGRLSFGTGASMKILKPTHVRGVVPKSSKQFWTSWWILRGNSCWNWVPWSYFPEVDPAKGCNLRTSTWRMSSMHPTWWSQPSCSWGTSTSHQRHSFPVSQFWQTRPTIATKRWLRDFLQWLSTFPFAHEARRLAKLSSI